MARLISRRTSFAFCSAMCGIVNILFMMFPVPENEDDTNGVHQEVYIQLALSTVSEIDFI